MNRTKINKLDLFKPLARNPKASGFQAKFKTEICRKWENGSCEFGDKCAFAHGVQELKKKAYTSGKYKTIKCKPFFEHGFCVYGPRCQFSHEENLKNTAPSTPVKDRNSFEDQKKRLPVFIHLEKRSEFVYN